MAQLNFRLDEVLVRRFETTAAAMGKTHREAAAEALVAWTEAHADAVRAVVESGTTLPESDDPSHTAPTT